MENSISNEGEEYKGEHGDKGDPGDKGIRGDKGFTGDKGHTEISTTLELGEGLSDALKVLADSNRDSATSNLEVASSVETVINKINTSNRVVIMVGIALLLIGAVLIYGQYVGRRGIKKTDEVLQLFVGCSVPSTPKQPHPCADRSQAQLAGAIQKLQDITIYVAECARNPDATDPQIEKCVQDKVKLASIPTTTTTIP